MRTILSFFIILFLLWGYASDILNAAPACTWRYKWVWDGSTRYACEVQVPDAGCWMNNGRQKRTAKCVREDGDGTSVAVAVANCATWDPYTGAKSLIETYDNGTCTMPCNAVCDTTNHWQYRASQPVANLCDLTKTYSTGITWTDTTAVGPDYTYNWNCASKNWGLSASCYAYKPTAGSCWFPSASVSYPTSSECTIGSVNWTWWDWNWTDGAYDWYCNWVNTGWSSWWCSSYKIRTWQACTPKIANSDWNTASSISQTYNGSSWLPTLTSSYNTTASSSECRYKCSVWKTWSWVTSTCN